MFPLSITFFLLALVVAGFGIFGTLGGGAVVFAAGFMLLAVIASLSFLRGRTSEREFYGAR